MREPHFFCKKKTLYFFWSISRPQTFRMYLTTAHIFDRRRVFALTFSVIFFHVGAKEKKYTHCCTYVSYGTLSPERRILRR